MSKPASRLFVVAVLTTLSITVIAGCRAEEQVTLNVSAGAGMIDAITEINNLMMQQNHDLLIVGNFAAAGELQIQIENGAPTDIFISAAAEMMNALEEKGLILTETRRNIVGNKLVLVVHQENALYISDFEDLLKSEIRQIAMGDPEFVPAGNYGLQTLELLGISFIKLQPKLILGSNVRQVLSYVESKSVDAGIVYASDAFCSDSVRVVAIAPDEINETIVFPVAVVSSSKNVQIARAYIDFLFTTEAQEIFKKHGFVLLVD